MRARRGQFNRFGQKRQRAPGATGNPGALPTANARLLFVLFYFKCYPLQEVIGVLFSHERRVVYLGSTSAGSVHDKTLADESDLVLPADAVVLQDTGFQGYKVAGAQTYQPRKKPRGRAMPWYSTAINQVISRVRVGAEHAISGVKRCRIVADAFRNWREGFVDAAMEAACGLHNLRVAARA